MAQPTATPAPAARRCDATTEILRRPAMKISSLVLGVSLAANLTLVAVFAYRSAADTSSHQENGGAALTAGPSTPGAASGSTIASQKAGAAAAASGRKTWERIATGDDLEGLVVRLRAAGF